MIEPLKQEIEQQPSREWKEIYAESEGSNSWIEFKCPHCGYSFGMESGEYDWHYGDEIPWKYCPICGGSAEHKPYKAESEE
jgi:rubrerythrin